MRTHEGKTRYMSPIYQPQHALVEGQESGFTYGVLPRRILFRELPGKGSGKTFRYHGFSEKLRSFFDGLYMSERREQERERRRRVERSMYDTISMIPVDTPGRHRMKEANQWPTHPQNLLAEASTH